MNRWSDMPIIRSCGQMWLARVIYLQQTLSNWVTAYRHGKFGNCETTPLLLGVLLIGSLMQVLFIKKMKMTLWKSTEIGHQQFSWEPPIETESCYDDSITVLCPTKRVPDLSGPFYKIGGASIMPCPSFGTQSCSFHSNRWSKRTSKKPRPRGVPSCNTVLPSLADGQSYFARISWW